MYKVKEYLVPDVFRNMFTEIATVHTYNTRQTKDFYVPYYRTNYGKFSIISHGPLMWKSIPKSVQCATSIHMFKKRLKLYIMDD